jgi:3',5'-cyclic AMP phosphodiesterase CpdA
LILCLDTQKSGSDAGEFCAARTAWLRSELEAAGDTPVFLFMHHPPHVLHLPMLDVDNMQNGDAFLDLVSEFDCVRYMLLGHVHRPVSGVVRGVPFSTMRSVLYQAPAPRPEWDWSTFQPSEEAPNFGVVMISDGAITIQYDQFCPYAVGGRA